MLKQIKLLTILSIFSLTLFCANFNAKQQATTTNPDCRPVIFFDLGDVLLETSKKQALWINGFPFKFLFKYGKPDSKQITSRLFELIDHQTGNPPRGTATHQDGEQMPALMCDWLEGNISSQEFIRVITTISPCDQFFKSKTEGRFILSAARLMSPRNLVQTRKLRPKMLAALNYCTRNPNLRVGILSNWDKDSIKLLKAAFPEIFRNVDPALILFSSELGCKKPDPVIYQRATRIAGCTPKKCTLVDDQLENCLQAQACGWEAIHHKDDANTIYQITNLCDLVLYKTPKPPVKFK